MRRERSAIVSAQPVIIREPPDSARGSDSQLRMHPNKGAPPLPFETIQGLLDERKDRYRELRAAGRSNDYRVLGAEEPSSSGATATAPSQSRAPSAQESRHTMLRMLGASYILPLIPEGASDKSTGAYFYPRGRAAQGRADESFVGKRRALIDAASGSFRLIDALDYMVGSIQSDLKLVSHHFDLGTGNGEDQRSSTSVIVWLLPRLLVAAASLRIDLAEENPRDSFATAPLEDALVDTAAFIARLACLVPSIRNQIAAVLHELLWASLQAFTASKKPAFSRTISQVPSLKRLLDEVPEVPGDHTLRLFADGIEASCGMPAQTLSNLTFFWLPEDAMAFRVHIGRDPEGNQIFGRRLLAATLSVLQRLPSSFEPSLLAAERLFLANWELDQSARATTGFDIQTCTRWRNLRTSHRPSFLARASLLLFQDVDWLLLPAEASEKLATGLRQACLTLSTLRTQRTQSQPLLRARIARLLDVIKKQTVSTDKLERDVEFLRKSCAWECIVSAGMQASEAVVGCIATISDTPSSEDSVPPWMSHTQARHLKRKRETSGARPLLKRQRQKYPANSEASLVKGPARNG